MSRDHIPNGEIRYVDPVHVSPAILIAFILGAGFWAGVGFGFGRWWGWW